MGFFYIDNGMLCVLISSTKENTQLMLRKLGKKPNMQPDLALKLTLIRSNCLCLEHIFMGLKVFEPLKFYCRWKKYTGVYRILIDYT